MDAWTLVALISVLVAGGAIHRSAGMGLALVTVPVAALLLGPADGVSFANVVTIVSGLFVLRAMWADIEWDRFARIGPLLVAGAIPGMYLVRELDTAILYVVIGAAVLLGFAVTALMRRHTVTGTAPALVAAFVAGTLNTTAGTAGPAMVIYRVASRWEPKAFAATMQPILLTAATVSIVLKEAFGASQVFTAVPPWLWPVAVVALLLGLALGRPFSAWLGPVRAGQLTIVIGVAGALVTLTRGLLMMLE